MPEDIKKLAMEYSTPKEMVDGKKIEAPQIAQGLWQTYGQIQAAKTKSEATLRAAKIRAGAALIIGAAGIAYGLWRQKQLAEKEEELKLKEQELIREKNEHTKVVNDFFGDAYLMQFSVLSNQYKLEVANKRLKSMYSSDEFERLIQEQDEQKHKALLEIEQIREKNEFKARLTKLTLFE